MAIDVRGGFCKIRPRAYNASTGREEFLDIICRIGGCSAMGTILGFTGVMNYNRPAG